jgi:lipopolysaccharide transport system ATP-binding protein
MYLRLAFAVAAHLQTEVLIVDEVLAVGDFRFQEKCLGKMQDVASTGRTVLFVSHSMPSIQRLCNRAIGLANGGMIADSSPDTVIAHYIGGELKNTYTEPPSATRATITRATLSLDSCNLLLSVEFQSPFPLVPPVLGFIIYNSLGAPIFGTNTRADPLSPPPEPSAAGRFEVAIPADNFRPDRYLFSFWLGDCFMDYCACEKILSVDLNSGAGGGLSVRIHGNIYLPTKWKYSDLRE